MTSESTTIPMRRRLGRRIPLTSGLIVLGLGVLPALLLYVCSLALRLDLDDPDAWLLDLRLAAIAHDARRCEAALASPLVSAHLVPDRPLTNGCGWHNAVRMDTAANIKVNAGVASCDLAAALTMWLAHDVQAAALKHLGKRVTGLTHLGTYSCRNIVGSKALASFRSQHATAAAIDITGFRLETGEHISIKKDWPAGGPRAAFLRDVHHGACRYFRVVIGPDFNAAHHDHFHVDRGFLSACR